MGVGNRDFNPLLSLAQGHANILSLKNEDGLNPSTGHIFRWPLKSI
jgi:hypothetical protein